LTTNGEGEHLDFWNYPDWGPEGSNNLRDPGRVPFWERPCKAPAPELPVRPAPEGDPLGVLSKGVGTVVYYRGQRVRSCVYSFRDDLYVLRLEGDALADYYEVRLPLAELVRGYRYMPAPF